MEDYIKVDVMKYVRDGLLNGDMQPRYAEKFARVIAKRGAIGENVISFSTDSNGNAIQEKVGVVGKDKETGEVDWILTKADSEGNAIVDDNGNLNQWIVDNKTFTKKYEVQVDESHIYKPKGGKQIFVQINDNIILNQWGSDMKIAKGGFINITRIDDMYGISKRDFYDTYKFLDEQPEIKMNF